MAVDDTQASAEESTAASQAAPEVALKPWSAFAYYDFTMLWLGGTAASTAMTIRLLISSQWIYDKTQSEVMLGLLMLVQLSQIPVVLFGGVLSDIVDRKKLMAMTQFVSFVSLMALTLAAFTGTLAVWHIFLVQGVTGMVNVLGGSARPAMIARVVPRALLSHAVSTNTATFQVASIISPLAFGVAYEFFGVSWAFGLAMVVSAVSVITPYLIRVSGKPADSTAKITFTSTWKSLLEGVNFVRRHKILPGLYLLDIGVTIVSFYRFLFPIFSDHLYGLGASGTAMLTSVNGLGGVAGSALVLYTAKMPRKGVLVLVATALYAFLLIAFGSIHVFYIGLIIVACLGATDAVGMVMRQTVVQLTTPDRLLGRASSAHSFAAMSANHLGGYEVGIMSALVGAGPTMIIGGVVSIFVVGLIWKFVPGVASYRYAPDAERDAAENDS
ncbi:MAG: MFS transporter [Dehalococcoidia bacterium]